MALTDCSSLSVAEAVPSPYYADIRRGAGSFMSRVTTNVDGPFVNVVTADSGGLHSLHGVPISSHL